MNSELAEEYGAGFEGTKALLYKYLKDTPGQKIIKYMDKNESTFKMKSTFKISPTDYKCSSEKSQFGGYRPLITNKWTGKTTYLGAASYNTPAEAKEHAENYLDQYARGISEPRVPVKGTYVKEGKMDESDICEARSFETFDDKHLKMWLNINWTTARVGDQFAKELKAAAAEAKKRGLKWMTEEMISNDKASKNESVDLGEAVDFRTMKDDSLKQWLSKNDTDDSVSPVFGAQILAAKKEAKRRRISFTEDVELKEDQREISLQTRRMMKIVALITGNTDADALYEYALTSPTYSSLVDLKENFNKYIQDA